MGDRVGARASLAIWTSAILAAVMWFLAYAFVWPNLDQPLIERIKNAAETQLADIAGPPDAVLAATDIASGPDSVSVFAKYREAASLPTVLAYYKARLPAAGWIAADQPGNYNRQEFCLRIVSGGQGEVTVELAWRRGWCHRGAPVPLFGVAVFAAGLGQLGLVTSWPWLQRVRHADPAELHEQMTKDQTFRLRMFKKNSEVVRFAAWSSAVSGIVVSLVVIVVAGVLAVNSWLLMLKWQ